MAISLASGLGLARIDHDQGPLWVLGDLPERIGGVVPALADARVGPERQQKARPRGIRMQNDRRRRAEHPLLDQVVLGLFLGESVEPAPRPETAEEAEPIGSIHVVGLPADADQPDRSRRVLPPDVVQLRPDLGNRGIPRDALELAVRTAAQRMLHSLRVFDIQWDAEALVADVSVRDGILLIGADRGDASARDIDADAAVVA